MTAPDPAGEYRRRLDARQAAAGSLQRRHLLLSNARLAVFVLFAVLSWLAFVSHRLHGAWVWLPVLAFALLMGAHNRVLRRRDRARRAARFYQDGLHRLEGRWAGRGQGGETYADPDHPYADDLDLFGRGSLFELLCTARTAIGRQTLAGWLKAPASAAEVRARQEAVAELRPRLDLREDLALLGEAVEAGVHPAALARWSGTPPVLASQPARAAALGVSAATVAVLAGWLAGALGAGPLLLALLVQGSFAAAHRARVRQVLEAVAAPGRELPLLARVLGRLEAETFTAPRLAGLARGLATQGTPPSRRIARLGRLMDLLDWRRNQFFAPLAALLMWSTHIAFALEAWRRRAGPAVPGWLEAVGEMEALCALAGQAWEHPADPFPEMLADPGTPLLAAEGLGHPLLQEEQCVRNDLQLGGGLELLLVSGSNMSGKSTLLRTVGVNVVLAQAGGTVRARRLRLSPLAVGASIRIHDSLLAGRSRFYAEITRLRELVTLAGGERPLLFLLDEILHGTNSHDRRIGAEAVIRGLLGRGALGLVTTHDLALARVAEALAPRAANIHFQDHLEDGRMVFDYRIQPGVVTHSNALALMRSVGLEV